MANVSAINAVLLKLVNKIRGAIFADDSSHGPAAFGKAESCREMNVNFRFLDSIGDGRLNVDECDLFYEDDDSVFERYGFHGFVFA